VRAVWVSTLVEKAQLGAVSATSFLASFLGNGAPVVHQCVFMQSAPLALAAWMVARPFIISCGASPMHVIACKCPDVCCLVMSACGCTQWEWYMAPCTNLRWNCSTLKPTVGATSTVCLCLGCTRQGASLASGCRTYHRYPWRLLAAAYS